MQTNNEKDSTVGLPLDPAHDLLGLRTSLSWTPWHCSAVKLGGLIQSKHSKGTCAFCWSLCSWINNVDDIFSQKHSKAFNIVPMWVKLRQEQENKENVLNHASLFSCENRNTGNRVQKEGKTRKRGIPKTKNATKSETHHEIVQKSVSSQFLFNPFPLNLSLSIPWCAKQFLKDVLCATLWKAFIKSHLHNVKGWLKCSADCMSICVAVFPKCGFHTVPGFLTIICKACVNLWFLICFVIANRKKCQTLRQRFHRCGMVIFAACLAKVSYRLTET